MNRVVIPDWVKDAVFYQIFPDTFARSPRVPKPGNLQPWDALPSTHGYKGGDLLGVVEHLDYLTDLGINAIYFCPIFQSASNHRYHTHDYYRVDPMLGGDPAFRELLDGAHRRGIRVVVDGVFNHASRGFFQFNDILENGLGSAYADWFVIRDRGQPLNPYDVKAIAEGKATWDTNYQCWWNLPALPEFNTGNSEVREFLWGVSTYWIEQGIDGWRLDVPEDIDDPSFWREFRRRVKASDPDAYLVGEIWHPAQDWLAGDRFDATMNYTFNRACQCFFGGNNLDTSVKPGGFTLSPIQAEEFAARVDEMLSMYDWQVTQAQLNLLGSHDTPRILSVLGSDVERLKLAILCQMTLPGAPCVYYGDEVGMTSVPVAGLEGRASMSWDEADWNLDLRDTVRRYIALRRAHPVLRRGRHLSLYASDSANVYAYMRRLGDETMIVILNNSNTFYEVHVPTNGELCDGARFDDQLGNGSYAVRAGYLVGPRMSPRSGLVLEEQNV